MTNSAPPAAMLYTYETDIIQNAIGAAAGGAAGTLAGPEGTVAGAVIGGVANVIDGCYEKVRK